YFSIGCKPLSCTRPVAAGEDPRSGRWAGQGKGECGINLTNSLDSSNLYAVGCCLLSVDRCLLLGGAGSEGAVGQFPRRRLSRVCDAVDLLRSVGVEG